MLDLIPIAAVRASVVLNYSWCGVRLDHRRREAGLSLYPSTCTGKGALLKRQPPDVGISQLREPFASEGRPSKQTNKTNKMENFESTQFSVGSSRFSTFKKSAIFLVQLLT